MARPPAGYGGVSRRQTHLLRRGAGAHGLRKSAAVRHVEAGCSSKEVAAITGHASLLKIERYTKAAEQEKLAPQAIARLILNG